MSNAVFPSLPGLKWGQTRTVLAPPVHIRTTPSRREFRSRSATVPRYQYALTYEFLRGGALGNELQTLVGFFEQRGGSFESFLFVDHADHSAVDLVFDTGDGVRRTFQLARSFGGFVLPVDAVSSVAHVAVGGTPITAYEITGGRVTFDNPPSAGLVLSWSGTFYRRVRFLRDQCETSQFLKDLHEMKKLELISLVGEP
jgi:uncharacterized protein (TIGR02217 family)